MLNDGTPDSQSLCEFSELYPGFTRTALPKAMESEDPVLLEEMYLLFLDQAWQLMLQIESHAGRSDYRQLRQIAHKLKSSAHTVGAVEVAAILAELEAAAAAHLEYALLHCIAMLHQALDAVQRAILAEIDRLKPAAANGGIAAGGVRDPAVKSNSHEELDHDRI